MLEYLTSSTASLKVNHQRGASNGAVGVVSDGNGRDFVVGDVDGSSRRSSSDSEKRPASILVTPSTLRSRDRDPNKRQRSVSFALPANDTDVFGERSGMCCIPHGCSCCIVDLSTMKAMSRVLAPGAMRWPTLSWLRRSRSPDSKTQRERALHSVLAGIARFRPSRTITLRQFCHLARVSLWPSQCSDNTLVLTPCSPSLSLPSQLADDVLEFKVKDKFEQFGNVWVKIKRDGRGMPYGFLQYEVRSLPWQKSRSLTLPSRLLKMPRERSP